MTAIMSIGDAARVSDIAWRDDWFMAALNVPQPEPPARKAD
jgi:hypothetical protein